MVKKVVTVKIEFSRFSETWDALFNIIAPTWRSDNMNVIKPDKNKEYTRNDGNSSATSDHIVKNS